MTQLFWFLITQSMKKKMVVEASTVVSEILFEHQNIWIDIQLKLRASIPNILFSDNSIPKYGIFENINSVKQLAQMPQWTAEKPLRVATGFTYLGPKFLKENGLQHITFSTTDGALEAAPAMGITDAIVDLVSSGTTLKENNLKEIEGGVPLESQNSLKDIANDSTSTPGDKNDFANDDYSKVKGPEKRGYVRLIGKIPTTKINDETNEIEQLKSVIHVMANVIQEHMPNANLSTFFKNMNVQVPRNISSNE